jgi:septal ring factor EnvC (AmiA/AmiB activator)
VSDPAPMYPGQQPQSSGVKTAVVAGALVALVAANVYLYIQVDGLRTDQKKQNEALMTEIANLKETSSVTNESQRRRVENLKEELAQARQQATQLAGQAKADAVKRAEALSARLAEEQQRQAKQTQAAIGEVKEQATTANTKIEAVNTDVSNVKTEVAANKNELDKTITDLKKVTGDLGITSGYVATNGKELAELKRLGERNYFDINLGKTKQPQRVGDIALMLKKTDPKRNKFTIQVVADDKTIEKKDKTANEPVQFLTAKGGRIPYEIVINQVKKDQIVGYLATPKVTVSRN